MLSAAVFSFLLSTSIEAQLAKLSASDPDGPCPAVYVRLSKSRVAAAILDDDFDGQLVLYRLDEHEQLHEITRLAAHDCIRGLETRDLDGDGRKEILFAGTPGNRNTPYT